MSIDSNKAGHRWIALGALNGLLAVGLGAFAAHGLHNHLSARLLGVFEKAVEYQSMHAFALLATGLLIILSGDAPLLRWSGRLFSAGILLFSGSLYILALSGIGAWGIITPLGGSAFLGGWCCLTLAAWQASRRS